MGGLAGTVKAAFFSCELTDGLRVIDDPSGQELPDIVAAREQAKSAAPTLCQQRLLTSTSNWSPWFVRVIDEFGQQIFTVRLPTP